MDSFLGQICLFSFTKAPRGWLPCDGSILAVEHNTALFSLLGTTYGGDGVRNFALPDLRGCMAVGANVHGGSTDNLSPIRMGESGGKTSVSLAPAHLPAHYHTPVCAPEPGILNSPEGALPAVLTDPLGISTPKAYNETGGAVMHPGILASVGNSEEISMLNPSLGMGYWISTEGSYPPRS